MPAIYTFPTIYIMKYWGRRGLSDPGPDFLGGLIRIGFFLVGRIQVFSTQIRNPGLNAYLCPDVPLSIKTM